MSSVLIRAEVEEDVVSGVSKDSAIFLEKNTNCVGARGGRGAK